MGDSARPTRACTCEDIRSFLGAHTLHVTDVDAWASRTAGRKGIEALEEAYGPPGDPLVLKGRSLERVGNLSSYCNGESMLTLYMILIAGVVLERLAELVIAKLNLRWARATRHARSLPTLAHDSFERRETSQIEQFLGGVVADASNFGTTKEGTGAHGCRGVHVFRSWRLVTTANAPVRRVA